LEKNPWDVIAKLNVKLTEAEGKVQEGKQVEEDKNEAGG